MRYLNYNRDFQVAQLQTSLDTFNRVTGIEYKAGDQKIEKLTYAYDAMNRLTTNKRDAYVYTTTGSVQNTSSTFSYDRSHTYDQNGRQTDQGTQYDQNGNQQREWTEMGKDNQLLRDDQNWYTYDSEGNLVIKEKVQIANNVQSSAGERWRYGYDHANRLVSASREEKVSGQWVIRETNVYTYDAEGNRLSAVHTNAVSGAVDAMKFASWQTQVIAHLSDNNVLQRLYLSGGRDEMWARVDWSQGANSPRTLWYVTDRQGSVLDMIDDNANFKVRRQYDAFGKQTNSEVDQTWDPYGYTGRELDFYTGLQYNRARWLDPYSTRWISQDPLGFGAGDMNLYRYVSGTPANATDPSGLSADWLLGDYHDGWFTQFSNFSAGIGDTISFGMTASVRQLLGYDDVVDRQSAAFAVGVGAGAAWHAASGNYWGVAYGGSTLVSSYGTHLSNSSSSDLGRGIGTAITLVGQVGQAVSSTMGMKQLFGAGSSAVSWKVKSQAAKGVAGASYGVFESAVRGDSLADTLTNVGLRGVNGVLDVGWSTYTSAAGGIVGAGVGYWAGGRRGAIIGMGFGELTGGLLGAGVYGYRNPQGTSGAGKVAARMVAFEAGGALAGAALGGLVGGWDGAVRGANLGRMAANTAVMVSPTLRAALLRACFAAGTPLLGEHGSKAIESFVAGEKVWSRNEFDPNGPLELKVIEEVFVRLGRILHLHVSGQTIRTTGEHPFYVVGKGWLPASELNPGDLLSSHDGQWVAVQEVYDTGEYETVYNLRVESYHTYFVGAEDWGFSVWAHNQYHSDYYVRKDAAYDRYLARMEAKGATALGRREWKAQFDATYERLFVRSGSQNHHLVTNKMVTALDDIGFAGGQALRDRGTLQYMSSRGGHIGYEKWHRTMDNDMVSFIYRNRSSLTEDTLLRYIHNYYQRPDLAVRIPGVNLGF